MRIVILALAMLPGAAIAEDRDTSLPASHLSLPAAPKAQCHNARTDYAAPAVQPARVRTLRQEPLASQYLGVVRMEDGCDLPVKIADGVGDKQR
ncbi:MAG TPA: hypothetical protein VN029_12650 [Sphingomonas sp.]|nr:hypothetical protein [Sphingomonas sp.]